LDEITFEELIEIIPLFVSKSYLEILCIGNLTSAEAIDLFDTTLSTLSFAPLDPNMMQAKQTCLELPHNVMWRIKSQTPPTKDERNAVHVYFQGVRDTDTKPARVNEGSNLALEVLETVLFEPYYNELRTCEQLAYALHVSYHYSSGVCGFSFNIVSTRDLAFLEGRIEAFVSETMNIVKGMSEEQWQQNIGALIERKEEADYTLKDRVDRLMRSISDRTYNFDLAVRQAKELRQTTREELIAGASSLFDARRMIIVWIEKSENASSADSSDGDGTNPAVVEGGDGEAKMEVEVEKVSDEKGEGSEKSGKKGILPAKATVWNGVIKKTYQCTHERGSFCKVWKECEGVKMPDLFEEGPVDKYKKAV